MNTNNNNRTPRRYPEQNKTPSASDTRNVQSPQSVNTQRRVPAQNGITPHPTQPVQRPTGHMTSRNVQQSAMQVHPIHPAQSAMQANQSQSVQQPHQTHSAPQNRQVQPSASGSLHQQNQAHGNYTTSNRQQDNYSGGMVRGGSANGTASGQYQANTQNDSGRTQQPQQYRTSQQQNTQQRSAYHSPHGASVSGNGTQPPRTGMSASGNGTQPPRTGMSVSGNGTQPTHTGMSASGNGTQPTHTGMSVSGNGTQPPRTGASASVNGGQQPQRSTQPQQGHNTRTYSRSQIKKNSSIPTHTQSGQKLTASQRHKVAQGKTPEQAVSREKDNTFASVIKAMLYIVFIIVTSGVLSYYIIAIGNDVFAFVKNDDVVVVSLDEGATTDDVARILHEKNVIKFPTVFKLYISFRGSLSSLVEGGYMNGVFEVSPAMGYDDLVFSLVPKGVSREEISVTIREGLTVNEIINIFVEKGIGTREGFIDVIQNHDFDYWFIDELNELNPDRTYRLEGYLYPDTYYFYTDSSEVTVINKFLARFDEMFDERYKESCEAVGMTVDEVIILASMIQMEGKYVSEYGAISSVFHNRLNNPRAETMGFLNSDATIQYALNERKSVLTSSDTELDSPYNTYLHKGLPPGPICCPSLDAMNYAMYPDDTDYYYFVSRVNGYSLFAATEAEHLDNIDKARSGQ